MRDAIAMTALVAVCAASAQSPEAGGKAVWPLRDPTATSALFQSIRQSDVRAVAELVARGDADVNGRSDEGDTPLMYAAAYSTAACMELLLEHRADPNARDKRGGTALMRSIRDLAKVKLLVAHGAEVDVRSDAGVTALMTAASRPGSSDVVKLLLEQKADPRTVDRAGVPPLMYATDFGDLESVKALVAAGARIDNGRRNGVTPLFWASNGPLDVLEWLLEHDADPNVTRGNGGTGTPLMEAALFGMTANAEALLDWGADVNAMSARGTPLMWAAGSDRAGHDMIRLLLDRGADPNVVATRCDLCISEPRAVNGSKDLTALMLARQRGETEIVRMLLAAGAAR